MRAALSNPLCFVTSKNELKVIQPLLTKYLKEDMEKRKLTETADPFKSQQSVPDDSYMKTTSK